MTISTENCTFSQKVSPQLALARPAKVSKTLKPLKPKTLKVAKVAKVPGHTCCQNVPVLRPQTPGSRLR